MYIHNVNLLSNSEISFVSLKQKGEQRRKKKDKEDVFVYCGHEYITTQFNIPTACEYCHNFLWLMEKGYVCQGERITNLVMQIYFYFPSIVNIVSKILLDNTASLLPVLENFSLASPSGNFVDIPFALQCASLPLTKSVAPRRQNIAKGRPGRR